MSSHSSSASSAAAGGRGPDPRLPVRAARILRVRAVWTIPLVLASAVVAVMTALYIGSAVNPLAHLRGLPVAIVNQDRGAPIGSQHLQAGQQLQTGLLTSPAVSGRLHLEVLSLPQAEQAMDHDGLYAALVIPPGFSASLLTVAGLPAAAPAAVTAPRQRSWPTSGPAPSGRIWRPGSFSPPWRRRPIRSASSWQPWLRRATGPPRPRCCWPAPSR